VGGAPLNGFWMLFGSITGVAIARKVLPSLNLMVEVSSCHSWTVAAAATTRSQPSDCEDERSVRPETVKCLRPAFACSLANSSPAAWGQRNHVPQRQGGNNVIWWGPVLLGLPFLAVRFPHSQAPIRFTAECMSQFSSAQPVLLHLCVLEPYMRPQPLGVMIFEYTVRSAPKALLTWLFSNSTNITATPASTEL